MENTTVLPIYDTYFKTNPSVISDENDCSQSVDWEAFKTLPDSPELNKPLSERVVDFSIQDAQNTQDATWTDSIKRVLKYAMDSFSAFFLYPLQRIVMIPLYPAQSGIVRAFIPHLRIENLNKEKKDFLNKDNNLGLICRDVVLEKNGVKYSGMLVGSKNTINNGKWALQAAPNAMAIENMISNVSDIYLSKNFNLLMINGPGVGNSQGTATPTTMGDAQEVGISFLETAIKAKKIVIAGYSLGGAAIGQAISQHEFKTKDVEYHVVRQMTFDRASNVCGEIVGNILPSQKEFVAKIIQLSGCEMDSVKASKKLTELGIKEIIVQATHTEVMTKQPALHNFMTDGMIAPAASLGYHLTKDKVTQDKVFIGLPQAQHMTFEAIKQPITSIENGLIENENY